MGFKWTENTGTRQTTEVRGQDRDKTTLLGAASHQTGLVTW